MELEMSSRKILKKSVKYSFCYQTWFLQNNGKFCCYQVSKEDASFIQKIIHKFSNQESLQVLKILQKFFFFHQNILYFLPKLIGYGMRLNLNVTISN